MKELTLKCVT